MVKRFDVITDIDTRSCRGVYALFSGEELVYIGKSENMAHRLSQHIGEKVKEFDTISMFPVDEADNIEEIESELIRYFRPKYNASATQFRDIRSNELRRIISNLELYKPDKRDECIELICFFINTIITGEWETISPISNLNIQHIAMAFGYESSAVSSYKTKATEESFQKWNSRRMKKFEETIA